MTAKPLPELSFSVILDSQVSVLKHSIRIEARFNELRSPSHLLK
ncbi:MAG: hypothetical protein PUP92_23200 [Rhizonema sp. PD38]|nr:hypothetical protein [Rhizonema sp. PD38]